MRYPAKVASQSSAFTMDDLPTSETLPLDRIINKSFSINFTLATGNYISIGKQFYHAAPMPESFQTDADNTQYREYIERPNNFRMPAYHHLDISYVLDNRKGKGSSWVFGIYNLYARENPSTINKRKKG